MKSPPPSPTPTPIQRSHYSPTTWQNPTAPEKGSQGGGSDSCIPALGSAPQGKNLGKNTYNADLEVWALEHIIYRSCFPKRARADHMQCFPSQWLRSNSLNPFPIINQSWEKKEKGVWGRLLEPNLQRGSQPGWWRKASRLKGPWDVPSV